MREAEAAFRDDWAPSAPRCSSLAMKRADVEQSEVGIARIANASDGRADLLEPLVVPVVRLPSASEYSTDDPCEVGIDHGLGGALRENPDRATDVLSDARERLPDSAVPGRHRSGQATEGVRAAPMESKGTKHLLQFIGDRATKARPIRVGGQHHADDLLDRCGPSLLEEGLSDGDPVGIAPLAPWESAPPRREPCLSQ